MKTAKMARAEKEALKVRMPLARVRWLQKLRRVAYLDHACSLLE